MWGWFRKKPTRIYDQWVAEYGALDQDILGNFVKSVRHEWRLYPDAGPLCDRIEAFAGRWFDLLPRDFATINRLPPRTVWRIILTAIEQTDMQLHMDLDEAMALLADRYADFTRRPPASAPRS